tara:strand:- start:1185 stop:1406 length:222 start_codon:yes stop_codon:yes gene_type:complete
MILNEKKEALLKELHDVNFDVHVKVHDGECMHDMVGNDHDHFWEAMRYVPNHVIKKWIKKCKSDVKSVEGANE